ncbi:TetR/AcrR family transcriptional regulator [Dyadobacter luteus]|jgi:TetR/AcrR family transcriptional repressor of nem operon|uniref:TetR/AcrR family transcriptional regulator n=1 Tax=Dyadobacter luteus TaxID=2259619 RepID=A0A3D8YHK6_9BACT|nr:TetR/AcrR family transcriptional regulator [Dyadobacter luteus]REA64294.1 TetR/AcrR family transcriptional regulator [Dyadobacter luteus]
MLTKAEKTKQFILETAGPLYNEKGISGVSVDDVLAATRLTKGCLYGHFENKEDLSVQVVDLLLKKISDKIHLAVADKKTAKGKIFAFLDFYKNPIDTYISGGCPIFNTAVEADDNYPVIKQKIASVFRAGQQDLINVLSEGINNGEFSSNLDASVFAFKLMASIEGGIVMCRTMETAKPMQSLIKSLKAELEQYVI